jgi:hypothetical protein
MFSPHRSSILLSSYLALSLLSASLRYAILIILTGITVDGWVCLIRQGCAKGMGVDCKRVDGRVGGYCHVFVFDVLGLGEATVNESFCGTEAGYIQCFRLSMCGFRVQIPKSFIITSTSLKLRL